MVEALISWLDVNGLGASNRIWVADGGAVVDLAVALKKLSNAKVKNAAFFSPVDISSVPSNDAVAENVETVRTKMLITLSAPPATEGTPRQTVTIQLPAPVGSYIDGLTGDTSNDDIVALVGLVLTRAGTATDRVDRVAYAM